MDNYYGIEIRLASKNGWFTPDEARNYYGRYSRQGITVHWWNTPELAGTHDGTVDYMLQGASNGVKSVNYVLSNDKITMLVNPDNVAWASQSGNPTTISIEFDPRLNAEGYKKAGWLIEELEQRYGHELQLYPHSAWFQTSCLPLDATELLTSNGWIALEEAEIGTEIAQWDNGVITYTPVKSIVKPYEAEVTRYRKFEATDNHRVYYKGQDSKDWMVDEYSNVMSVRGSRYLPCYGIIDYGDGIDIDNTTLQWLVWVQADGSYMYDLRKDGSKGYYGIEFHLKKRRKIDRISTILDDMQIDYSSHDRSDGTHVIRTYGRQMVEDCERWLHNKAFTWKMIGMNDHQYRLFVEELLQADGCLANNSYSSSLIENIDFVQALMTTHGQTSHVYHGGLGPRLFFNARMYSIDSRSPRVSRVTMVSCVEVESGAIVIREHGQVLITGNCPGNLSLDRMRQEADKWARGEYTNAPTPAPTPIPTPQHAIEYYNYDQIRHYVITADQATIWDFGRPAGQFIDKGNLTKGQSFDAVGYAIHPNGSTYVMTSYSYNTNPRKTVGVNINNMQQILPQQPTPPEPIPATPVPEVTEPIKPEWVVNLKNIDDTKYYLKETVALVDITTGSPVQPTRALLMGNEFIASALTKVGKVEYRITDYSFKKGVFNGVPIDKLILTPPGVPDIPPVPNYPTPEETKSFLQKLVDMILEFLAKFK